MRRGNIAKLPDWIKGGKIDITGLDLFHEIIDLLKEVAEKDPSINYKLAEIMTKYNTEYEYTVKEE